MFRAAEALSGLATAHDFERDISLDEVRFALSTLDPTAILPHLATDGDDTGRKNARSKIAHALLLAQELLTTGELAERAGVSKQSIRNHRDDLEALGLLESTIERWPWLRPWIDTICWLFGHEGDGSLDGPSKWIDGPYELTSRFGMEPATTQTQLPAQDRNAAESTG